MTHDEIIEQQAADYLEGAAVLMDDDIREAVHMEFAPCSARFFLEEYRRRHLAKFGEEFVGA
jgi:hypothetical protein